MMPYELCPRFEKCSVNVCLLHPDYKKLLASEFDPDKKCTLPKSIRKRLGVSLAWKGLKDSEIAGQKRWDALPENEKQARIQKIKERSLINRLSAKGYRIAPKNKDISESHIKTDIDSPETRGGEA